MGYNYSQNQEINELLNQVVTKVSIFLNNQDSDIHEMHRIATALSSENNNYKLLAPYHTSKDS